ALDARAPPALCPLSLHDALPICAAADPGRLRPLHRARPHRRGDGHPARRDDRPAQQPVGDRTVAAVGRRADSDRIDRPAQHRCPADRPAHPDRPAMSAAATLRRPEAVTTRVDLHDLDIYYGDFQAVTDVTLTVPAGEVTAFIGPSGCGKSSVLRAVNRMHETVPGAT